MIIIYKLFTKSANVLDNKILKCSKMLEVVSKDENDFRNCIEAFRDATQEYNVVKKYKTSRNAIKRNKANELKSIIDKVYDIVVGKYIYFADHEDHDISMLM